MKNRFRKKRTKSRLFHVKHHPNRPHTVPFPMRARNAAGGRRTCPAHVSTVRPAIKRGWLHSPARPSESESARGDRFVFPLQDRASGADSFSIKYSRNSRAPLHPAADFLLRRRSGMTAVGVFERRSLSSLLPQREKPHHGGHVCRQDPETGDQVEEGEGDPAVKEV